jgi:dihydrodiol dehydrogenase / D-xylose 1-dehydrogenase (NADP)
VIVGTKGRARVLGPAHIAAALELTTARGGRGAVETERLDYPLPPLPPADVATLNYPGSQAFCYQAAAVQGCLARGELESAEHPNDEMLALLETMDVIRAQIGVEYD